MPSEPYMPSTGTEGAVFEEHWCRKCKRDTDALDGDGCSIVANALAGIQPSEWKLVADQPVCTAYDPAEPAPPAPPPTRSIPPRPSPPPERMVRDDGGGGGLCGILLLMVLGVPIGTIAIVWLSGGTFGQRCDRYLPDATAIERDVCVEHLKEGGSVRAILTENAQ